MFHNSRVKNILKISFLHHCVLIDDGVKWKGAVHEPLRPLLSVNVTWKYKNNYWIYVSWVAFERKAVVLSSSVQGSAGSYFRDRKMYRILNLNRKKREIHCTAVFPLVNFFILFSDRLLKVEKHVETLQTAALKLFFKVNFLFHLCLWQNLKICC